MPWRNVRTRSPATFMCAIRKNFSCSTGPPLTRSITGQAFGPWIWKRQYAAGHRPAVRPRRGAVVVLDLDVVAAGLRPVREPVGRRVAPDPHELVLVEVEEDAVPDHVPRGGRGHELLGHVDGEVGHAVDARVGDEPGRVRPAQEQVHHVMRLVEQDGGLTPGPLLPAPVAELVGDHRVDVGADLRVTQQRHRIGCLVEDILERVCHQLVPFRRIGAARLRGFTAQPPAAGSCTRHDPTSGSPSAVRLARASVRPSQALSRRPKGAARRRRNRAGP